MSASPLARAEYYYFSGRGGVSLSGSDIMYQETRYPVWSGGTYNARWYPTIGGATSTTTNFYSGVAWSGTWNTGTQSNSYLQSFWGVSNPVNPGDAVTPEWWHPDMRDVPSIGEGASGKVDGKWPMASGTWYPTAIRVWQPTENPENISKVGQWFKDGVSGQWRHFSTFRMPFLATHFKSDMAFIEDTGADGPRRVDIRNYYFRKSGAWTPGVTFKAYCRQSFERGTSGVIEGGSAAFFETTNNDPNYVGNMGPGETTLYHTLTMPATPTFDPAVIGSVTATATSSQLDVKWSMTPLSSPQFSYKIEVFPTSNTSGTPALTVTKIDPDTTEALIPTSGLPTPTVKVTITDVFDQLSVPVTVTASSPALANASTPSGTVAGLNYKYYETSLSVLPDFSTLSSSLLKGQGAVNMPDLTVRKKHTSYACQFTGYVDVPADGIWMFSLGSCDGSRLRVDGATVIDHDGVHSGASEKTGAVALKAGKHPVELQYFMSSSTAGDDDQLRLSWEGPGVGKTLMRESCWARLPAANEPVVTLTSPAAGATIPGADAPLTATVTANGNTLNSVRFFNKNTVWATKTGTSSPFTTTTLLGAGANHLKARLVYGSGAAFTIDSAPVDLTATQQVLSPWTFSPLGMHAFQSAASYNAGTWSMVSDGFNFAWQEISGDETIIARVADKPSSTSGSQFDGVNYTSSWGGGVMFREDLVANPGIEWGERFVALYKENGNATRLQCSDDVNGGGAVTGPDLGSGYTWYKLQRAGTLFTAWLSNDGITWTQVGTRTMAEPFTQKMYVGLFTLARPSTNPNPQWWKFDNVSLASAGAGFQITQHPASQSVFPETTVELSTTVVSSNPLTYQWQHDGANIPGATAATLTLDDVQASDAGNYRVLASDGITTVTSNEASLTVRPFGSGYQRGIERLGPLAYWRLNEAAGPTAVDYIGGHNGTFVGGLIAAQAGPRAPAFPAFDASNAAIKFNGSGSRIEVPALNLNTDTLTISAWVKRNGNAASFSGIVFSRAGTSVAGLTFGNANELRYTWNNTSSSYNWNSGLVPPDGQWTFVTLVVEPTKATIYMNPGTGLVFATNNVSHSAEAFDGTLCIGQDTQASSRAFNGSIDEVALFDRVLTAGEVGTLSSGNTTPTFVGNPVTAPSATEGAAYSATLVGTVDDSDSGEVLTYAKLAGGPAWLNVAPNGALSGTPGTLDIGLNSFGVRVTDAKGATSTGTLDIMVVSNNHPPAFAADPINLNASEDSAFTGQLAASDVDAGETLTFTKIDGPSWLIVSTSGALSGTPANADVGVQEFTVRVTDGRGGFDEAALDVTVANVNDAPTFGINPITGSPATEGAGYIGTLAGSATDMDANDGLTYSKVGGPLWLSVAANGALSGTPPSGAAGPNSFVVSVTDTAGASANATLNIAVAIGGNGVWTNAAGGSWSTPGNWSGGTVASGIGKTGDFSTLNLTADATVTLAEGFTVGNLIFSDTTASNNWIVNGSPLTLDLTSGMPNIAVNNGKATLNVVLAGTKGLAKTGAGNLTLGGANLYSGGTTITPIGDTTAVTAANASALGSGTVLVNGPNTFSAGLSVNTGLTISNALTLKPTSSRAVLGLSGTANWSGTITVDGSSSGNLAVVSAGGSNGSPSTISGDIGHTGANNNILVLRSGYGNVTGSITYGTGTVQLLDGSNWQFSNASNTWGTLDINNASAIASVGAANTLSPTGVVSSSVGGTLRLSNQAGSTAYSQTIAGLSGSVKVGIATGSATLTLNTPSNQSSSGVISGAVSLVKSGSARQSLSGSNTYTSATAVSGGTLLADNSTGSATGTGAVTVNATGTLGGIGAVSGAVTVNSGGTLAPGASIESLATGGLTLASGSSFAVEYNSSGVPSSDVANVTGNVSLAGNLNLTDLASVPAAIAAGTKLTILTYTGTLTGSFAGRPEGSTITSGPNIFLIRYADGNAVTLDAVSAIVTPYGAWASAKGLNASNKDPEQDPDNDGIKNLLEFYLGGNPLASDGSILPTVTLNATHLVVSFQRNDDAEAYAATEVIQLGSNLTSWSDIILGATSSGPDADGVLVQITENETSPDTITVSIPRTLAVAGNLFARLKVMD